jgi:hypothetical protein
VYIVQVYGCWLLTVELQVQSWATSCEISGGPNNTGADFSLHFFLVFCILKITQKNNHKYILLILLRLAVFTLFKLPGVIN